MSEQPNYGRQYYGQQNYGQPTLTPKLKPKKKRSGFAMFFLVVFSPLIAAGFVLYGIFWVLAWLLTPVALAVHFVLCGLGVIWYSAVKLLASGRSKYRLFQPLYPRFPPLWTGAYWVRLNRNVRSTARVLGGILELLDW